MVIPWPDSIAVFVSATIHGNDERGRLMRRTIVRYPKTIIIIRINLYMIHFHFPFLSFFFSSQIRMRLFDLGSNKRITKSEETFPNVGTLR